MSCCSALSFEVLYDSTDAELGRLRSAAADPDHSSPASETRLYAQPYVVSEASADRDGWMAGRRLADLRRRVAALTELDDGAERALPAGQLHLLREALHISPEIAQRRFETLCARYPGADTAALAGPNGSLFWRQPAEPDQPDGPTVTGLLDAMNAVGFLAATPQGVTSGAAS